MREVRNENVIEEIEYINKVLRQKKRGFKKLAFEDFQSFKSLISCLVFIHSRDSVEIFDKTTLQKYLA